MNKSIFRILRRFFACAGPGYLVAVGYMDPGNWATDLAGGSRYGYTLLSVILLSNFIALLLQYCALKLGIVTGKDLARACRDYYSPSVSFGLWILAEIAIIATDLAEVIGSAIGLQLLFGIPLMWGIALTICDVLLLIMSTHRYARRVQFLVTILIAAIIGCFSIILYLVEPSWQAVGLHLIPTKNIVQDQCLLYLAIGILGATVMPHNLYLHSSLVTHHSSETPAKKKISIFYSAVDLIIALTFAFFVNAAILIVAAAVFYTRGLYEIADITEAYYLFTPLLKTSIASFVFAVALLISGQNSTLTGTLAGQAIMEGFINFSLPFWLRRLLGRIISIIPAFVSVWWLGESCISQLMIVSQVVLSLQLPFAIFPLLHFTSSKKIMGQFVNSFLTKIISYAMASLIVAVNAILLYFLWDGL